MGKKIPASYYDTPIAFKDCHCKNKIPPVEVQIRELEKLYNIYYTRHLSILKDQAGRKRDMKGIKICKACNIIRDYNYYLSMAKKKKQIDNKTYMFYKDSTTKGVPLMVVPPTRLNSDITAMYTYVWPLRRPNQYAANKKVVQPKHDSMKHNEIKNK